MKKPGKGIALFLFGMLLVAINISALAQERTQPQIIPVEILYQGNIWRFNSDSVLIEEITKDMFLVIDNPEALVRQYKIFGVGTPDLGTLPQVDFTKNLVLMTYEYYYGTPSEIFLKKVYREGNAVYIDFDFKQHREECEGVPQLLVIAIPRTEAKIIFLENKYLEDKKISSRKIYPEKSVPFNR